MRVANERGRLADGHAAPARSLSFDQATGCEIDISPTPLPFLCTFSSRLRRHPQLVERRRVSLDRLRTHRTFQNRVICRAVDRVSLHLVPADRARIRRLVLSNVVIRPDVRRADNRNQLLIHPPKESAVAAILGGLLCRDHAPSLASFDNLARVVLLSERRLREQVQAGVPSGNTHLLLGRRGES